MRWDSMLARPTTAHKRKPPVEWRPTDRRLDCDHCGHFFQRFGVRCTNPKCKKFVGIGPDYHEQASWYDHVTRKRREPKIGEPSTRKGQPSKEGKEAIVRAAVVPCELCGHVKSHVQIAEETGLNQTTISRLRKKMGV